jgi:hypothetical protein
LRLLKRERRTPSAWISTASSVTAQHAHEQVVAGNLTKELLVGAGFLIAAGRPVSEVARREAGG